MHNWADELRGSVTYGGKDLSGDPRMARDPRSPALANNRMMQQPQYMQGDEQPGTLTPTQPYEGQRGDDVWRQQMEAPEQHAGTLEDARRQGAQQAPGASRLIQILRMLGIM